jgi:membrane fusion protein, multidrug efflux system
MIRLFLVAALVLLAGCNKSAAAAPPVPEKPVIVVPPIKVETEPVGRELMPRFLTLTGNVLADRQSEVAANVAGRITATYVERGKSVKTGDILAVVDSKAAGFSVEAANAQSQAAETQVELAKQECARADTLFSQGAIAKSEHDRMKSQCSSQLFQANAARANANLAGKLAGDTVIRAPIDGVVGERYVNVGEYVTPATRVASLYSINPVRVSISVPEQAVGVIKEGQTLDVRVSAYDQPFPAVIKYVSPALRPNTRDLIIEALAPNLDGKLRPGMFATILLLVGEEEQPTVPSDAIKAEGTVRRMFLARDGHAFELVVRTGVKKAGRVAVLEPLTDKDKVIVNPPPGLRDGSSIQ